MLTAILNKFDYVQRLRQDLRGTRHLLQQEVHRNTPRPARLIVKGSMTQIAVEEALNGTENNAVMQAVCAVINAKIVELSDKACDRPRLQLQTAEGMVAGYSAEERLHDAGGSANLAELLSVLQELAKPKDVAAEAASR